MRIKRLPSVSCITLVILYTLWFFHDFPTQSKDSIVQLLTSADSVEICFYTPNGSNLVVRVNEKNELTNFIEILQNSHFISMSGTKATILGHAVYSARGQGVLCVDFCQFPLVLFNGRSYAVSPDFTILARSLVEMRSKHE